MTKPLSIDIIGMHHYTWFMQFWDLNPRLHECEVNTLPSDISSFPFCLLRQSYVVQVGFKLTPWSWAGVELLVLLPLPPGCWVPTCLAHKILGSECGAQESQALEGFSFGG